MKIIAHRANGSTLASQYTRYAEVDAQISNKGEVVIHHDPQFTYPVHPEWLLKSSFRGFLVNIKQALSVAHLAEIADVFGSKLMGLFDIPYPAVYHARCDTSLPIYARYSAYEPFRATFDRLWLDPFNDPHPRSYFALMSQVPSWIKDVIVAGPSLHGGGVKEDTAVLVGLKNNSNVGGIVTKFPRELSDAQVHLC